VVVPAPELLSIDVAVGEHIGMVGAFRKGAAANLQNTVNAQCREFGVQHVFTTNG
jgi:hypothetical protein